MIEVLLETVVTKLESQGEKLSAMEAMLAETVLLKQHTTTIDKNLELIKDSLSSVAGIEKEVQRISLQLKGPYKNQGHAEQKIIHSHHLHKGIGITISLLLTALTLVVLLVRERIEARHFREVDIKYRYIKLTGDRNIFTLIRQADSLYKANPSELQETIEKEEQRREALFGRYQKMNNGQRKQSSQGKNPRIDLAEERIFLTYCNPLYLACFALRYDVPVISPISFNDLSSK